MSNDHAIGAPGAETGIARIFAAVLGRTERWLTWSLGAVLAAMLAIVLYQVAARALAGQATPWAGEVVLLAISYITFIGGAVAYRGGGHASVSMLASVLSQRGKAIQGLVLEGLVVCLAVPMAASAADLMDSQWWQNFQVLEIPVAYGTAPLVAAMILIALFALERLATAGLVPVILAIAAAALAYGLSEPIRGVLAQGLAGDTLLAAMLVLFFATVLVGLPIAFGLMLSASLYLYVSGAVPLIAVTQNMASSAQHFVLLAIPFFLLAGIVMERGGISVRFVNFAASLVGHLPGGLLQVVVVATYLVSGISGSKVADVAAVGSVMREMLLQRGYRPEQIAAVLAASAAMAETVPPSIAMLVLAAITSVSLGALFMAGLLPAAVIAVCIMVLIYWQARRAGETSTAKASSSQRLAAARSAILPLCMPLMLMLGIRFGVATPTEVSGVAVLFGLVLAALVYRELGSRDFLRSLTEAATTAGMVLFVLSAAAAFAWTLTIADLPQRLAAMLAGIHGGSAMVFMVATIVMVVLVSCLLEGLPALLIMAPLLMPAAVQVGIDPIQYGIVLLFSVAIGVFLPPIGIAFIITCGVARAGIAATEARFRPFLAVLLVGLLLIAAVPWISLIVPQLTGGLK